MVRADGADQLSLGCTTHTGHFGTEGFSDLYREQPHASGGTDDQHLLAWLDPACAKSLEGSKGGGGYGCRLLEGEIRRLEREHVLSGSCVLGEGAVARAEDLIVSLKAGDVLADRFDSPGDIHAPNTSLDRK